MVLDYARSGYRSKMKLWQDKPDLTSGVWFRTVPSAKFFERPHLFANTKTWYERDFNQGSAPGEREIGDYYNSKSPGSYDGKQHCGSDDAMSQGGITGVDPPLLTDATGMLPCCKPHEPNPCYPPGYSKQIVMTMTSQQSFCPCGHGTTIALNYVGLVEDPAFGEVDMWEGPDAGQPPAKWGNCQWFAGGGATGQARFRMKLKMLRHGPSACAWVVELKLFVENPSGVYGLLLTEQSGCVKAQDNPLKVLGGTAFRQLGADCGMRFLVAPTARMNFVFDGFVVAVP